VFGAELIDHFTLVLGAATRQLAYATSSLFVESLGQVREAAPLREQLELASLGGDLMARMPDDIIRPLVLRHAIESQAFSRAAGAVTEPVFDVATGFCDLVGSTALLNSLDPAVAGRALLEFEAEVADAVQRNGGRLIKLIGDEVLFLTLEVDDAVTIGREVIEWVAAHDVLTGARAGIAVGRVLTRGGDVYGPPVNLAARLVHVADPGAIAVADDRGDEPVEVRGFDEPVLIRRIAVT
jgi:adenylate cyclase